MEDFIDIFVHNNEKDTLNRVEQSSSFPIEKDPQRSSSPIA